MAATSFSTLTAAQATAAEYFTTAPAYITAVYVEVLGLSVRIDRDGNATQA